MNADSQQKHEILRARARALAREPQAQPTAEDHLEVIEFVLAGERYAVESAQVREAYPLKDLTPLPCTPPFVLGIMNVRGRILAVIDLRTFFDRPREGLTGLNKVVVIGNDETAIGILADAVIGVHTLRLKDLQPSLPTLTGIRAEYLRGVTNDRVAVLDAARILSDERILVNEEVRT